MSKKHIKEFKDKVEVEGLDYAIQNYIPEGDMTLTALANMYMYAREMIEDYAGLQE